MSGRIYPNEVSLHRLSPHQISMSWRRGSRRLWPRTPRSREGWSKTSFSLEGSIKNHINIHDVYQSKSGTSVSSALLIASLRAAFEGLDWNALHWQPLGNRLRRLTSVGLCSPLQAGRLNVRQQGDGLSVNALRSEAAQYWCPWKNGTETT